MKSFSSPVQFTLVRRFFWLGLFAMAVSLTAQVPDELKGNWVMDDGNPALLYPANQNDFAILGANPGKSTWADGVFFLRWARASSPERGYYSLKTGRVWVTTYRWVNREEERVEYSGTVERNDDGQLVWTGTAKTTGQRKTTWKFIATKG